MIVILIITIAQAILTVAILICALTFNRALAAFDKILYKFVEVNQVFYKNQATLINKISDAATLLSRDNASSVELLHELDRISTDSNALLKDTSARLTKMHIDTITNMKRYYELLKALHGNSSSTSRTIDNPGKK